MSNRLAAQPTIGILAPALAGDFAIAVLSGIHAVLSAQGFQTIAVQGSPQATANLKIAQKRIDGWLVLVDAQGVAELAPAPTPAVIIGSPSPDARFPSVIPDNTTSMQAATEHLIAHGHTRLAFIGNLTNLDIHQRCQSYQATLRAHGLVVDPALIIDVPGYRTGDAAQALQPLLQHKLAFTAIVAGTDDAAIGVMSAMHAAGYRIPEDIAIIGFDDIDAAQYTKPALTTVRQWPHELGRIAARLLCSMLAGATPASVYYAPTALVQRRSCGCQANQKGLATVVQDLRPDADQWFEQLARQLIRISQYPLPLDPATDVQQIWPEKHVIVSGLAAALAGSAQPDVNALDLAWQALVELNDDTEILLALLKQIERTALAITPADPAIADRVAAFLDACRQSMMQARLSRERDRALLLNRLLLVDQQISMTLSIGTLHSTERLRWLNLTGARSAVLALWEPQAPPTLRIDSTYVRGTASCPATGQHYTAETFPPAELIGSTSADSASGYTALLPIVTPERDWGYLALRIDEQFTTSLDNLYVWISMIGPLLARDTLEQELQAEREMRSEGEQRVRLLADTVRDLGCPIIPLRRGMLLIPLIGVIDSHRGQQIIETVLTGVVDQHATYVLIDISGVPLVDTHVAGLLMDTTRAVMLLGAQAILVGVRPEIAQSIVALGIDLRNFTTYATLEAALAQLESRA